MTRVFLALFINTGLIILVVNADFGDFSLLGTVLFNGKYHDFDREWYLKVGVLYVIMGFFGMISPHTIMMALKYPLTALKRACCLSCYKT